MKTLSLIVAVASTLGALALSGCSSCSQQDVAKKAPPPVTCGPGTVASGSQCIGTVQH